MENQRAAETVRPIRDLILVQPEPMPERQGLIHLPRNAQNKRCRGKVLAVGPGRVTDRGVRVPPEVKPGDRVIYSLHNMAQGIGLDVGNDKDGPLLMPEMDIEAVLEETVAHPLDALGSAHTQRPELA